ncbi:MAG: thioredoxin domain-containing protein [Planctomycetota bacterium]|jgi:tetratricopeptide (TPR) repeat protein
MLPITKNSLLRILTFALMVHVVLLAVPSQARSRKIKVGDKMLQFSLPDPNGIVFTYRHNRKRVLAIAYLSANQKQSERAVVDIERILGDLRSKAEPLDFVGVISERAKKDFFESYRGDSKPNFPILLDTEYQLWGRLGIIAMPTVLIVGKNDKVVWVKAGHGYDFEPVIRARLNQALGIAQEIDPNDASHVRTVTNATVAARVKRHLQTAKILQQKDRLESAIVEARKAEELDPNSIEVVLELGELLCRAGQSKAALDVVKRVRATKRLDRARLLLISGWAKRQAGQLDAAEKLLLETTTLNPKYSRAFFELGKVYQARGRTDKAMVSYYKALAQIFGEAHGTKTSHK